MPRAFAALLCWLISAGTGSEPPCDVELAANWGRTVDVVFSINLRNLELALASIASLLTTSAGDCDVYGALRFHLARPAAPAVLCVRFLAREGFGGACIFVFRWCRSRRRRPFASCSRCQLNPEALCAALEAAARGSAAMRRQRRRRGGGSREC